VIADDVPEVVALLLRQGRDAAGGVGPAGGVFEGHRAIGVDRGGFEQLLAAPQVFFADDVFFAVGVAGAGFVAAGVVLLARAPAEGVVAVAPVFVVGGVEVGEAVVAVPAVLPALRTKAVAVDDFFGQAAAGIVAVCIGPGLDHAPAFLLGIQAHALGAVDLSFAEQVEGVVVAPLLGFAPAQAGGDQLLVGVVAVLTLAPAVVVDLDRVTGINFMNLILKTCKQGVH